MVGVTMGIYGSSPTAAKLYNQAIEMGIDARLLNAKDLANLSKGELQSGHGTAYRPQYLAIADIHADLEQVYKVRALGIQIYPDPRVVQLCQSEILKKQFLKDHAFPVSEGYLIAGKSVLKDYLHKIPFTYTRLAASDYPEKAFVYSEDDVVSLFDGPGYLEVLTGVKYRISVQVARNANGDTECYDPVLLLTDKTEDMQVCPAPVDNNHTITAIRMAIGLAELLGCQGLLTVLCSLTVNNELVVSGIIPGPHYTGNHTIESAETNQYEQHLRGIFNMPLGYSGQKTKAVSFNVRHNGMTDEDWSGKLKEVMRIAGAHIHWYGNNTTVAKNVLGHLTLTADTIENAYSSAIMARHIISAQQPNQH